MGKYGSALGCAVPRVFYGVMDKNASKLSRLQPPTFVGGHTAGGAHKQVSRRRILQGGAAGAIAAGLGYSTWATTSHLALASNPSPNGFTHSQAEFGNLFYDYGSQNLMEIASAVDIPELIEFKDDGEQSSLGFALAENNEFLPDEVPIPKLRPESSQVALAQSGVPIPPMRQDSLIPEKLDLPTNSPLSQPTITLAAATQPDLGSGGRRVYTPSDALSERLGRSRRTLNVHAVNLGERLNINYFRNGRYDTGALAELDNLFRDRHSRKTAEIDPGVYDQLFAISNIFQGREINMLSGYRAKETNEAMRRRMAGVAKFSYHVRAQAVDFYISNISISEIHVAALKLSVGGVGYYPGSNFVHVDTGPLRNWPSRYASLGYRYRQT